MKTAIIGAGYGGMSAAHDLAKAGNEITIFEGAAYAGGLAAGFKEPQWRSSVEHFYHHWFQSDADMFGLMEELGLKQNVYFPLPKTVSYYDGKFYPLDSPMAVLKFPAFNLLDVARFGFVTIYLRYLADWKSLEKVTAAEWIRKVYGKKLYDVLFQPMLEGKFGRYYEVVNMAWFWARFKARTTRLGTYKGGFQQFSDDFAENLRKRGVDVRLNSRLKKIEGTEDGKVKLTLENGDSEVFDQCLVTTSPGMLASMASDLPAEYLKGLLDLKSMGAVVMVLSLKHKLSPEGYYWYTLPKSAGYPFLALVEHTNFVSADEFNGEHILYVGDYLETDHPNFERTKEEILEDVLPVLTKFNPEFKANWVNKTWMFRAKYAQPIPLVDHSKNIPATRTPIKGLYFASMSQVYPWDRGTNFAVQIGRSTARQMLEDQTRSV